MKRHHTGKIKKYFPLIQKRCLLLSYSKGGLRHSYLFKPLMVVRIITYYILVAGTRKTEFISIHSRSKRQHNSNGKKTTAQNALQRLNKISKLSGQNNNITSINYDDDDENMLDCQPTKLSNLHGSGMGGGGGMSQRQQRLEKERIIRISKVANIPYCKLPLPYNICRRTTDMNALRIHNYVETLKRYTTGGKNRLKGRGLLKRDPNTHDMHGSQAPTNNQEYSETPTMSGTRSLGDVSLVQKN